MGRSGCATIVTGCFIVLLLLTSACWASHPYHVSYAEVAWNPRSGNFEVALCVWPSDLEKAVAAQEKKSIDLDKVDNLDALLEKYVQKKFVFSTTKDQAKTNAAIRWVGHEKDLKKAWLYFEVIGDDKSQFSIENKMFFELNDDQSNHIQLTNGDSTSNLVCNRTTAKHQIAVSK